MVSLQAPEGETQPSTEVDLFISTEKIMVLNTDLKVSFDSYGVIYVVKSLQAWCISDCIMIKPLWSEIVVPLLCTGGWEGDNWMIIGEVWCGAFWYIYIYIYIYQIYPAFSLAVYNRTFQCMKPPLIGPFNAWKPTILDIKNQRGARNRVHFCDELVLYGIRLLT